MSECYAAQIYQRGIVETDGFCQCGDKAQRIILRRLYYAAIGRIEKTCHLKIHKRAYSQLIEIQCSRGYEGAYPNYLALMDNAKNNIGEVIAKL